MAEKKEYFRWVESTYVNHDIDWRKAETISAGIDVGSVSSQMVVMCDGELYAYSNTRSGSSSPNSAKIAMDLCLKDAHDLTLDNIHYLVGTGYGMEVLAEMLKIPVTEIGDRSCDIDEEPGPVSSICVVFAKSEATGLLKCGWSKNKVLAAYCAAMAGRVAELLNRVEVEEDFAITGGIAKNKGIVKRIEKLIGVEALAPKMDTQIAGALGAAIYAKAFYKRQRQ